MTFRHHIIIMLTTMAALLPWADAMAVTPEEVHSELLKVDREIENRKGYLSSRRRYIQRLKDDLDSTSAKGAPVLTKILGVANAYSGFNTDSALTYYARGGELARQLHADSLAAIFDLNEASLLPLTGMAEPAIDKFNSVDTTAFGTQLLTVYHDRARQMYSYLDAMYPGKNYAALNFRGNWLHHQRRLLQLLPRNKAEYLLVTGEYSYLLGQYRKAWAHTSELMAQLPADSYLFARAAYLMSQIAKARDDEDQQVYYLAQSASADIKAAILEINSLQSLGRILYDRRDIDRAYLYLSKALESAVESGSALRVTQSGQLLPTIEDAHSRQLEDNRRRLLWLLGGLGVVVLVMVVLVIKLRAEMTRINRLRDHLAAANSTKEVYISQFLQLCSIYMDKLNQFSKYAARKISTGKVDDLYKMTKSGKFVEEQSKEFYEVFDHAFLHLYPDFPEAVNALLRPDAQLPAPDEGHLDTDYRILAFMRLGIEESSRIAELLNYSVNTIYAYRNRLRNRAIDRDNFERDIMAIAGADAQYTPASQH